jgi:hypothetical protein
MALEGAGDTRVVLLTDQHWAFRHFMFDRLLNRAKLSRDAFYRTSLQNPDWFEDIRDSDAEVVVCFGERTLRRVLDERDIERWRGRPVWHNSQWNKWVVPMLDPRMLLPRRDDSAWDKNPMRFCGVWIWDIRKAVEIAKHGFTRRAFADSEYLLDPDTEAFTNWIERFLEAYRLDPTLVLSVDIETPYKRKNENEEELELEERDNVIIRISFSYKGYTGVTVPHVGGYLPLIRQLLQHPAVKTRVVWNGTTFDIPIIEANAVHFPGSSPEDVRAGYEVWDGMDMWHFYQSDLPKGLEVVTSFTSDMLPWKHLNYDMPELYSAIDPDAAWRNVMWVKNELIREGRWDTYLNHYVRLMPALYAAGQHGNLIDTVAREALRAELEAEFARLNGEAQPLVPACVKPRKRYKRRPWDGDDPSVHHDVIENEWSWLQSDNSVRTFVPVNTLAERKFCSHCGCEASNKTEHFKGTTETVIVTDKKGNTKEKTRRVPNPCKAAGATLVERLADVVEWDEVLPFNANSTDQLTAYVRHVGHPMGKNKKDSSKEACDAQHLKTLDKKYGAKHPIYKLALALKKISKTKGTYIYDRTDENGRIHQTYKNSPSTPRLAGANYNLTNVGKREENLWAKKARKQIVAAPGHCFVQADSSAIEALIQGWWMNDPVYMDLATKSVHAYVVAKRLGIEWTGTEEQVEWLKKNHKNLYNKMKTVNYLSNFGGSPNMMHMADPDSFPTLRSAQEAQEMLYEVLPKLRQYHHWVRTKAHKETFLELPGWKHRHYFWDVFAPSPMGAVKLGHDAKRCLAMFPQGCAAAFGRDSLLLFAYGDLACDWLGIERMGLGEGILQWMPANVFVHDGYTFEVPLEQVAYVVDYCEKVLTRPIKQLSGLRVGCEIDVGPEGGNWADYHEEKNPMGMKTVRVCRVPVIPPPAFLEERAA